MALVPTVSHSQFFFPCRSFQKLQNHFRSPLSSLHDPRFGNPGSSRFVALASGDGSNGNRGVKGEVESGGSRGELKRDRRPGFNLRWRDLLNPDPENILAVGLTGLLTWASVQVLFQLFFISLAIVLAALKYSLIAALLLFILIALL